MTVDERLTLDVEKVDEVVHEILGIRSGASVSLRIHHGPLDDPCGRSVIVGLGVETVYAMFSHQITSLA